MNQPPPLSLSDFLSIHQHPVLNHELVPDMVFTEGGTDEDSNDNILVVIDGIPFGNVKELARHYYNPEIHANSFRNYYASVQRRVANATPQTAAHYLKILLKKHSSKQH